MSNLKVNEIYDASGGQSAQLYGVSMRYGGTNFVNRIINGDMRIDQRNAGASGTSAGYTVDRWAYQASQSSKGTWQQNAGSVTPPTGFSNYLGFTSSSAYSVLSSDYFLIDQYIEGFNVADLAWGTANAQTVTLSFKVYSSLTGTFGGALTNSAVNRSYPFTYTISSANTWTTVSITIVGDTTGTWLTTNGIGMRIRFGLGVGSTYSGTAGSWASGTYPSATGATSVVGTNGATFYITGVQLEAGSVATPFERRPYGTELALCQRYYHVFKHRIEDDAAGNGKIYFSGASFPTQMRATPTATTSYTASSLVNTAEVHFRYSENYSFIQGIRETGSGTAYANITNTFSSEL